MKGDGRVRVFARVRPQSPPEEAGRAAAVQLDEASNAVRVLGGGDTLERKLGGQGADAAPLTVEAREFVYDGVFPASATQEDVFAKVGLPVMRECLRGINGTILAYGQTGSGKTHSLLHQGARVGDEGLLLRLVNGLYAHIARDAASTYDVEAAAMQVYNEQVDDLLVTDSQAGGGQNLSVQEGGVVPGLAWTRCEQPDQMLGAFARARRNIVYAETNMNKASSRSHAIFQVRLTRHEQVAAAPEASGGLQDRRIECTCARLSVVDLAGSERVKKSGAEGAQFKEATAINKSLLALGNVVSALAAKKAHVPLRDSKLTRVLDGLIGGTCKTALLVCASPAAGHAQETLCSLEFASRAMCVEVNARVNRCMVEVDTKARRARPPSVSSQRASSEVAERSRGETQRCERAVAEAEGHARQFQQAAEEAEQRGGRWKERAEHIETAMRLVEEEAKQLHVAVGRAEQSSTEWRVLAERRAEEAASARRAVTDEAARAARAEERAIMAVANLELVQREAEERVARAEERTRMVEADLEAARCAAVERVAAAGEGAAEERRRAGEALQGAAADANALRRQVDAAQRRSKATEAEFSRCDQELQLRTAALAEAHAALERLREEADLREAGLQEKLIEAVQVGEEAAAKLRDNVEKAHAADAARAALIEERSRQGVAAAALEAQAAREAAMWMGEREGLEAAHVSLVDAHRADFTARLRTERQDCESRVAELKRERASLRRRLEQQQGEFARAEARWRQAKEDATREEHDRCSAEQRRAAAAFKAERDLSAAREAELLEANARLTKRLNDRESREEDLEQIADQQLLVQELRWDLELRRREIDGLRGGLEGQEKSLGIRGCAPPLPGKKLCRVPLRNSPTPEAEERQDMACRAIAAPPPPRRRAESARSPREVQGTGSRTRSGRSGSQERRVRPLSALPFTSAGRVLVTPMDPGPITVR